ncbi:MAG: HD domain-containing protein [Planctomycetota bacterium]|nr:HD domain-containing protein [Planctomycetota bacterium]
MTMDAVEVVENLQRQAIFGDLVGRIEGLIGRSITEYLAAREAQQVKPSAKAVKDAVWGMIDLTAPEMLVLDSPPLQRLRFVRQLGVTYLTFPTAGYCRYEHTLGAMHQAERMLVAIAARSESQAELLANRTTVRLAALLHDVGHMPFSHVAERYYTERECTDGQLVRDINRLKEEVANTLPARMPRLSECLSLALALTPGFQTLLGPSGAGFSKDQIAEAVLSIVGRPPSLARAFLAQLITNIIDADKLDYMFRDAFCTGVPLAVDLERLLFKLRCLSIDPKRCPDPLRRIFSEPGIARVLGTDLAGLRHAHDLALSRGMLFERVYHHHKTLAAERLVMRMLANMKRHPAELLAEDDRLFSPYAVSQHPQENHAYLAMLNLRQLPRRAFALSYGFLLDTAPAGEDGRPDVPEETREEWANLERAIADPRRRSELEHDLHQRASQLAGLTRSTLAPCDIWVDTPPDPFELPEVDLLIERPDGSILRRESFPADAAAFAHNPRAISYIYVGGTDQRGRELVFLATEMLIATAFGLGLGRLAADHAKIDWQRVERLKRLAEAATADLFNDCRFIRPRSYLPQTPEGVLRIEQLTNRFAHYNIGTAILVNAERIRAFLDQFPEKLVEPMLRVLEKLVFLDRTELGKQFAAAIYEAMPGGGVCVPLSKELHKSAAHLSYFLADHVGQPRPVTLDQALTQGGPITFFDDCLLSGKQGRTIIQTWFGQPKDLDEDLADELNEQQRETLRNRKPRFRFLRATTVGLQSLRQLTQEVGLGSDVSAVTTVSPAPKPLDEILDHVVANELREFLAAIGTHLLRTTRGEEQPDKWTPERCAEYALGYGGLEQLLVLAYNTPTGTLTPLWKGGRVGGMPWFPLFPRRNEPSPDLPRCDM